MVFLGNSLRARPPPPPRVGARWSNEGHAPSPFGPTVVPFVWAASAWLLQTTAATVVCAGTRPASRSTAQFSLRPSSGCCPPLARTCSRPRRENQGRPESGRAREGRGNPPWVPSQTSLLVCPSFVVPFVLFPPPSPPPAPGSRQHLGQGTQPGKGARGQGGDPQGGKRPRGPSGGSLPNPKPREVRIGSEPSVFLPWGSALGNVRRRSARRIVP